MDEKFKVGDKVRYKGSIGVVERISTDEIYTVLVDFDDRRRKRFTPEGEYVLGKGVELFLVEENKTISEEDEARTTKKEVEFQEGQIVWYQGKLYVVHNIQKNTLEIVNKEGGAFILLEDAHKELTPNYKGRVEYITRTEDWKVLEVGSETGMLALTEGTTVEEYVLQRLPELSQVHITIKEHNEIMEGVGQKLDQGKLRWSLLPWKAAEEVVKVLEFGAQKYAPDNWRKVPNASQRYKEAAMRHMVELMQGRHLTLRAGEDRKPI